MSAEPRIIIRPEAFGAGFDVVIEPPIPGEPLEREFPDLRAARGYASGLKMVKGWPVVDRAGADE